MGKQRFLYDKTVRAGSVSPIVLTDYHPDFPIERVQGLWRDYAYRSKYGTGSGWGYFKITSSNQWIDFDEGGGELWAQIPVEEYDADTLAIAIKTAMEAAGGAYSYTITYQENINRFTIASPSGNFDLLWQSGTHSANSVGDTIGFNTSVNDTGISSYTAASVRIHSAVSVEIETAGNVQVVTKACAVYGLNLTSSPQSFKLQRYTTSWVNVVDFEYDYVNKRAVCFFSEISDDKYRIYIEDRTNPDGYVQVGTILLGDYEEISRGYEYGASADVEDTSEHMYSKKGYITVAVGFKKKRRAVIYEVREADETKLENIYNLVGKEFPFVFIADSAQAKETMEYAIFKDRFSRSIQDSQSKRVALIWEYEIR